MKPHPAVRLKAHRTWMLASWLPAAVFLAACPILNYHSNPPVKWNQIEGAWRYSNGSTDSTKENVTVFCCPDIDNRADGENPSGKEFLFQCPKAFQSCENYDSDDIHIYGATRTSSFPPYNGDAISFKGDSEMQIGDTKYMRLQEKMWLVADRDTAMPNNWIFLTRDSTFAVTADEVWWPKQ